MYNTNGKVRFWKIMLEDERLTEEEFVFLREYNKMKIELEKEIE